jgi:hypothetical protein
MDAEVENNKNNGGGVVVEAKAGHKIFGGH